MNNLPMIALRRRLGIDGGPQPMTKAERTFDVSREPADYEPSTHLIQRIKERVMIDEELVAEAIAEGEVDRQDSNGVVFSHEWLNSTIEVVVAPEEQTIQTAYEVEA